MINRGKQERTSRQTKTWSVTVRRKPFGKLVMCSAEKTDFTAGHNLFGH